MSLEDSLDKLLTIARDYELGDQASQVEDRIRDQQRGLMVLVSGEGNFGKSSLVNALAGKEIAPVSIVPTTFKVDIYNHSPDDREYARVRRVGETTGTEMDIRSAERECQLEEERIQESFRTHEPYRPSIIEVEWSRTGLKFGKELCLVDTPGLAQLLLNTGAAPERLVRGLGSAYYVEDVWEMWYHRADIVLWCFAADLVQAIETRNALEIITERHRRTIIPVMTKADLVPKDDWSAAKGQLRSLYSDVLEIDRDPLLTSCRDYRNPNEGVTALLHALLDLAPTARREKLAATQLFASDVSLQMERILCMSAEQGLRNLHVIMDTADEIALHAMKLVGRAMGRIKIEGANLIETKVSGLKDELLVIYNQLRGLRPRRSNAEYRKLGEDRLRSYLEENRLNEKLSSELESVRDDLRSYTSSLCETKSLERARISSRLHVTREKFSIALETSWSKPSSAIEIPPIVIPEPKGCAASAAMIFVAMGFGAMVAWIAIGTTP